MGGFETIFAISVYAGGFCVLPYFCIAWILEKLCLKSPGLLFAVSFFVQALIGFWVCHSIASDAKGEGEWIVIILVPAITLTHLVAYIWLSVSFWRKWQRQSLNKPDGGGFSSVPVLLCVSVCTFQVFR